MRIQRTTAPAFDVFVVDRRRFDRSALITLCTEDQRLVVVASTDDCVKACAVLAVSLRPSVVILGRTLIRRDGPGVVDLFRKSDAGARVVLVGIGEDDALRLEAVRVGADGFFPKDGEPGAQLAAIRGEAGVVPRWTSAGSSWRAIG